MRVVVSARISFLRLNNVLLCGWTMLYLSLICGWTLGCFRNLAAVNNAAVSTGVCLKTAVIAMCLLSDGMTQDGA